MHVHTQVQTPTPPPPISLSSLSSQSPARILHVDMGGMNLFSASVLAAPPFLPPWRRPLRGTEAPPRPSSRPWRYEGGSKRQNSKGIPSDVRKTIFWRADVLTDQGPSSRRRFRGFTVIHTQAVHKFNRSHVTLPYLSGWMPWSPRLPTGPLTLPRTAVFRSQRLRLQRNSTRFQTQYEATTGLIALATAAARRKGGTSMLTCTTPRPRHSCRPLREPRHTERAPHLSSNTRWYPTLPLRSVGLCVTMPAVRCIPPGSLCFHNTWWATCHCRPNLWSSDAADGPCTAPQRGRGHRSRG